MSQASVSPAIEPVYLKLHHVFLALCVLLAPLAMAGWFTLCPQYGDPACPNSVHPDAAIVAFRTANPLLIQISYSHTVGIKRQYGHDRG